MTADGLTANGLTADGLTADRLTADGQKERWWDTQIDRRMKC